MPDFKGCQTTSPPGRYNDDTDSDVKNLIKKIKDISKHPFVIIIFAVVVLYLFYYFVSPYQQCLRDEYYIKRYVQYDLKVVCSDRTHW